MYFQFRKMILLYETPNSKVPALYKTLVFLLFEYLSGSNRLFFGYKGKSAIDFTPQFQKKHETSRQTLNRYQILNLSKKGG